jgi:hypothetical protein
MRVHDINDRGTALIRRVDKDRDGDGRSAWVIVLVVAALVMLAIRLRELRRLNEPIEIHRPRYTSQGI